ncbi:SNF2 family N-terminal domain-containing protein [Amylocarpus encephaloides]|uniref:SNF2 family N-terminal domain-containing protein n=1 Tax=Amylocarpus encephaloides TaxID=45428 RepID=A0A9P8C538_9HELO|nr:SNF2 family N-terminal domain-containing protein [Amylocarpus encephaloides]
MANFEDIYIAWVVNEKSKKWANGQGRLWTEFGIELLQVEGLDVVRLTFAVKWNITTSPLYICQAERKPESVSKVLDRYFPEPHGSETKPWSPQAFYKSAYSPDSSDNDSKSLSVPGFETDLYPFQRRSIQWLLKREGVEWSEVGRRIIPLGKQYSTALTSFISTIDATGRPCFVSHLFGLVTMDITSFRDQERSLKGGILAEEMGLGKTVEMLSLIALNKRSREPSGPIYDIFSDTNVRPTAATLIIAPQAISVQWISEINKHAPHLKVAHYHGARQHDPMTPAQLEDYLAASDIVVSSYSVLANEVHYTSLNPTKSLRTAPKYPRAKSPLMSLQFFRVVLDEAQMIESGVSQAATVAKMVPRVYAWCVTGTPVRRDVRDLLGLLVFLRYEPFASMKHVWSSLISSRNQDFKGLFSNIALRHSKLSVRDELKLPSQRRYVITMPFTPIEEQHYQEIFNQMCEACELDSEGAPLIDQWDLVGFAETMRKWLVRLRQTALHPEVGNRNRRALGNKDGPLRTVDQVLEVMIEQTDLVVRTEQRSLLTLRLKRGQLFENSPQVHEALGIWTLAAKEASIIVEEGRQQLQEEIDRNVAEGKYLERKSITESDGDTDGESEPEDSELTKRLGTLRNRVRSALEIQHVAVFFCANAHFQIKSNEEMTKPDSPEFLELEKLETDGYNSAKSLRREILQEIFGKADQLIRRISRKAKSQSFVQIPNFSSAPPNGGIEIRRFMERLDALGEALDAQAGQLDEWREKTVAYLRRPLVDEDEGIEVTGDEYEESTKTQDEVMVYVQALRTVIADRHDALTGQENKLIEFEVKTALRLANEGDGPFPEKTLELLKVRKQIKPPNQIGFVRRVIGELRALANTLRLEAERGNLRAQSELTIVDEQLKFTQQQLTEQTKATAALEKEVELFSRVMNTRLEYYRQLQQVSDMVAPYEGPNNAQTLAKFLREEEKLANKIAQAKSKRRYMQHLRAEASNPQEQRICVICRECFEIGALTVCGHQYCKECIQLWWSAHRNCPVCKRKLIQADLHEITYKPQELSIRAEEMESPSRRDSSDGCSSKSAIYSELSKSKLAEIKNIELDGPSFTTKVDTLVRHLTWLRESDPGAKSIIFSQFKDFLEVLALAFQRFKIGFSAINKPNGIQRFKHDPSVECFLLHARAHSSGLNLVNASHVFLCEPLLNTALELQAIARVDRIGQTQDTSVWLYLVDGTVEESIHSLSVKRRMQHMSHLPHLPNKSKGRGKSRSVSEEEVLIEDLEEANSMELQQASRTNFLAKGDLGGEIVQQEDLWECLFGKAGARRSRQRVIGDSDLREDREVARHLRAEAAEIRQDGGDEAVED